MSDTFRTVTVDLDAAEYDTFFTVLDAVVTNPQKITREDRATIDTIWRKVRSTKPADNQKED